jgi:hydrophobe/amphiphile efflux-1 (HAE1) family protein
MERIEKKNVKHRTNGRRYRGVSSASIRRPVGTMAIATLVIVLGFYMLERLPVDLLPQLNYPQIRVTVNYPGTAPEVMEEQVTRVLETNLASTENLVSIQSRASEGRTNVNLIFEYGTNIDLAIQDASRNLELARTQLPPDIEPPRLYKFDPAQDPIYQAGFTSSIRSPMEVRDWLENNLVPQLISIHGVGGVEVAGGMVREIQVVVDQDRLHYYGLAMQDVIDAVASENIDIAAGQVTSETFDVMAKTDGRFASVSDIELVMIPLPNSDRRIPLSEIATVSDTHRDQRMFVRLNGESATQLSVTKLPDANTVQVVDQVAARMQDLHESGFIPPDLEFQATRDSSFFIRSSIRAVSTAAILGALLAMLVVMLFLGSLRKSFVIGISIPIAITATFAMMGAGNLTLNIMSLGGLALGVGLLLDNSIVMLENIYRHRDRLGKNVDDAAHDGSKEVSSAIIAATMTNLAAVLPFLLIIGIAAMLFTELILTISFAIVASLAAALTIVPMLSTLLSRIKFSSGFANTHFIRGFNRGVSGLTSVYRTLIGYAVRWRYAVIVSAVVMLALVFFLIGDLGSEFLPQVDDGGVSVGVFLPPGTTPDETNRVSLIVEEVFSEMPYIESTFALIGGHLGGGIINERPATARWSIQLVPASQRREMPAGTWVDILERKLLDLELAGARINVSPPRLQGVRTNIAGTDISLGIVGDDVATLDRIGRELLEHLDGIEGLARLELSRQDRSPLLSVNVDRERAAALGLKVGEIGSAVRNAVHGAVPTRFSTGRTDYDIRVMLPREQTTDPGELGNIIVHRNSNGTPVYLRDVADFSLGDGPAHIERENQVRVIRLSGDVNTSIADVGTVNRSIRDRMAEYDMPDGYSVIYGGEEEAIREANRSMFTAALLAIFMVFVVLAVQYERLANPFVILSAVPFAVVGAGLMLFLTGTNLSAPVLLGVILLIGIVVNNAILLVEYIEIGRREQKLSPIRAAVEAGTIRFRPIMMTTLTTVFGMMPLAIGLGQGAEMMRPLALSVVGGLLMATFLTLFVVPCLYIVISGFAEKLKYFLTGKISDEEMLKGWYDGDGESVRPEEVEEERIT